MGESRLIRVSDDFIKELNNLKKKFGKITYPKLTKELIPYIKKIKIKKLKYEKNKNIKEITKNLENYLKI